MIGDKLRGSGKRENMVPVEQRVNGSWIQSFEGFAKSHLVKHEIIHAEVRVEYTEDRPFDKLISDDDLKEIEEKTKDDIELLELLNDAKLKFQKIPYSIYYTIRRLQPDNRLETLISLPFDPRLLLVLRISKAKRGIIGGWKEKIPAKDIFEK